MRTLFLDISEEHMLPCLSKKILGFDCPGCGLQRSVAFLLEGDFIAAFKMYPAIYPLILLLGFVISINYLPFKNSNKWLIGLSIVTVSFILINYILKFI